LPRIESTDCVKDVLGIGWGTTFLRLVDHFENARAQGSYPIRVKPIHIHIPHDGTRNAGTTGWLLMQRPT
jgi:hypothetical protein